MTIKVDSIKSRPLPRRKFVDIAEEEERILAKISQIKELYKKKKKAKLIPEKISILKNAVKNLFPDKKKFAYNQLPEKNKNSSVSSLPIVHLKNNLISSLYERIMALSSTNMPLPSIPVVQRNIIIPSSFSKIQLFKKRKAVVQYKPAIKSYKKQVHERGYISSVSLSEAQTILRVLPHYGSGYHRKSRKYEEIESNNVIN